MKAKAKTTPSKTSTAKKKTGAIKDIPARKNPYGGARNQNAISPQRADL